MQRTLNFLFNLGTAEKPKDLSISFLINLSGSMNGEPQERVRDALIQILTPLVDTNNGGSSRIGAEQVNLFTFHSTVQKICPWVDQTDFDFFNECLLSMDGLFFKDTGATVLYDGIAEAINSFEDTSINKDNEKILIVFTDGGENESKKKKEDIELLIKKMHYGYISGELLSTYNQLNEHTKSNLFLPYDENNEVVVFSENALMKLGEMDIDDAVKTKFAQAIENTKNPVRIFSLLYAYDKNEIYSDSVKDFSEISNGELYFSPEINQIPEILKELIENISYDNQSSFRANLLARLKDSPPVYSNAFRIFSFNQSKSTSKWFNREYNEDRLSYAYPVYNFEIERGLNNRATFSKEAREKVFSDDKKIIQDIYKNIDEQNQLFSEVKTQVNEEIDANPVINIVFYCNDETALVFSKNIIEIIDYLKENYIGLFNGRKAMQYNFFLMLYNYTAYNNDIKKELHVALAELYSLLKLKSTNKENPASYKFILLTDNNKSSGNSYYGYSYNRLEKQEFENHVIENLYNWNFKQEAISRAYDKFDNRYPFISVGCVNVKLDREYFLNKNANLFASELLNSIVDYKMYYQNEENFNSDKEDVDAVINTFCEDIKFHRIREQLLKTGKQPDLFDRIHCPDIRNLIEFKKRLKLKYVDRSLSTEIFNEYEVEYKNETDFIRHYFFDLKNYVEAGNSMEFFSESVNRNYYKIVKEKIVIIKNYTNQFLFQDSDSSPLKAKYWITQTSKRIEHYRESGELKADIKQDKNNQDANTSVVFQLNKREYTVDDQPKKYHDKLVEKLKSLPLKLSLRLKYYSVALVVFVGLISHLLLLNVDHVYYSLLAIPLLFIFYGEYKLYISRKQIKLLTLSYYYSSQLLAKKKAFEYITNSSDALYKEMIDCLVGDSETTTLFTANISEQKYFELLKISLTKKISSLLKLKNKQHYKENRFLFYLSGHNKLLTHDVIGKFIESLKSDKSWKERLSEVLKIEKKFKRILTPFVELNFIPVAFNELSTDIKAKLNVYEIVKDKKYYIVLYEALSDSEGKELLDIENNKLWKNKINSLLRQSTNKEHVAEGNLLSSWREIAEYEDWLLKLKLIVENDEMSKNLRIDYIFNLWKKKYIIRKQFIKSLHEIAYEICKKSFSGLSIWKILSNQDKKEIEDYIRGNTFPAFQLKSNNNQFTWEKSKLYLAHSNFNFDYVEKTFQTDIFSNIDFNHIALYVDEKDELGFMFFSEIPLDNSSEIIPNLTKSITEKEMENNKDVIFDEMFIKNIIDKAEFSDPLKN